MRRNPIAEGWDLFARTVLPPTISIAELTDMRLAFYAGVNVLFGVIANLPEGPDGVTMLEDVQHELDDFDERVKQGLA